MDSARLGDMVVLTAEQLAVATEDERDEYERYVLGKVVEADEWDSVGSGDVGGLCAARVRSAPRGVLAVGVVD